MNILDFAKDGNADETFAQIREAEEFNLIIADELVQIADDYEKGNYGDSGFCDKVIYHFNPKPYTVVLVNRSDPEEPQIEHVQASTENEAYDKFAHLIGYEGFELEKGEELGEITIHIKEVKIK
jgi:hypothetical protein